jgi:holo-[acyl-carrier protein] synthase
MKILGIGVDIVENFRVKKSIKNKKFISRIFTTSEITLANKTRDKISYYSKRFAAKEAFSKSIGTGFRNGLNFKDISVKTDNLGKPTFIITDKIKQIIKKQFRISKFNFFLSISDEKKYSIAYVILQKNDDK